MAGATEEMEVLGATAFVVLVEKQGLEAGVSKGVYMI